MIDAMLNSDMTFDALKDSPDGRVCHDVVEYIRFKACADLDFNGAAIKPDDLFEVFRVKPLTYDMTVLNMLREQQSRTGTKEGCAEGDCGACSVVVVDFDLHGRLQWKAINSCIYLVGQLDGKALMTIEDLPYLNLGIKKHNQKTLHPLQEAMIQHHGSQCGFCTPGIIMSMAALYHQDGAFSTQSIERQLAGNLCRCTGYRPIVKAASVAFKQNEQSKHSPKLVNALETQLLKLSDKIKSKRYLYVRNDLQKIDDDQKDLNQDVSFFVAPTTLDQLLSFYHQHKDAVLLSGGSDVGLWITKQLRDLKKIIWLGHVKELRRIEEDHQCLTIWAGATYQDCEKQLTALHDDLGSLICRIGGAQIRACASLCANIANGSPIGDMPPALLALETTIYLRSINGGRLIPLEDFFIEYGKQNIKPGEIVEKITIEKLKSNQFYRVWKISKRFDQDISTLTGGFCFTIDQSRHISAVKIVFGGMAGIPKRAKLCEQILQYAHIDDQHVFEKALSALDKDFTPIDDARASRWYRAAICKNLLRKCFTEMTSHAK
ncbi:MAG: xanthine dehydrogenase small subunit [Pseudomonadota bacterium]